MIDWVEQPISRSHDRAGFDCGVAALNLYLSRYARQNHEGGGARTFVAVRPDEPSHVLGYYTISPGDIAFANVPSTLVRHLGQYEVPVYRLGRLAVSQPLQGKGLGEDLLFAAGARALAVAEQVGGIAIAIDAKDEAAARWYRRFGALPLLDDPQKLILPLAVIETVLREAKS
jgi:GNAT superfamily N-acetyltransferase